MDGIALFWVKRCMDMGDFALLDYEQRESVKKTLLRMSTFPTDSGDAAGELYSTLM
jgi:hypothetical protein